MRNLRKADVKSAVFSVPHSKEIEQADNSHASTPLRRALSRAAGMCRIYIAQQRGAGTQACQLCGMRGIPASLRESAIIGM